jgi:cell division initiation protein
MTDEMDAEDIARKQFSTSFRGFDQYEVRAYLGEVATTMAALREREKALRDRIDAAEERTTASTTETFDLEAALGAETTKVLHAAREAAAEIRSHAEESVARLLREATDEAAAMRAEAESILATRTEEADAEAATIIAAAETRGREMVGEAQAVRERMLKDLSRKRKVAAVQLEQLLAARQRLLDAYDVVRQNLDGVTEELAVAEEQARLAADIVGLKPHADEPEPEPVETEPVEPETETEPVEEEAAVEAIVIVDDELADAPQGSATTPDDRRSSSLRLLRPEPLEADDPGEGVRVLRPEAAPAASPVSLVPDEPESEPESEPETEPEPDEQADDLFARLRADRAAALEHAETVLADAPEHEAEPESPAEADEPAAAPPVEEVAPEVDAAFEVRDGALEPIERALVKALKRSLADEQNEVLDTLRRAKRTPSLDDLMPAAEQHAERYRTLADDHLRAGMEAGAASQDGPAPAGDELAPAFAAEVAGDVRGRVGRALDSTGSDDEALVAAISAAYREWKTARTEPFVRHHLAAAYAAGAFAAAGDGPMRWVVDPAEGACPDCDDNALAGPTAKGDLYPTGQAHPPAHDGCRCLLLPPAK